MIGTSYPFTGFLPDHAKTIHIDIDPATNWQKVSCRCRLAGEAKTTIQWFLENVGRSRASPVFRAKSRTHEKVVSQLIPQ